MSNSGDIYDVNEEGENLIVERGVIKATLTRYTKYFAGKDEAQLRFADVKVRADKIKELWDKFDAIQNQIELLKSEEEYVKEQESERELFETRYFELVGKLDELLSAKKTGKEETKEAVTNKEGQQTLFKIPPISLPKFKGKYDEWVDFYNTFSSLIHNERKLTGVQKFHYLKSVLEGQAADQISSLPLTESNYEVAWEILCNRYNNNKVIIETHLKALTEMNKLTEQTAVSLQTFLNIIEKNTRALKVLRLPVDQWDTLLLHIFTKKLDHLSLRQWEEVVSKEECLPSMDKFKDFLKKKCTTLESLQSKTVKQRQVMSYKNTTCLLSTNKRQLCCHLCKGDHFIFRCNKFISSPVNERLNIIKKLKLCVNCFAISHQVSQCKSVNYCKICSNKHNTLLHIQTDSREAKRLRNTNNNITKNSTSQEEIDLVSNNRSQHSIENTFVQQSLFISEPSDKFNTSQILLQTAIIFAQGNDGQLYKLRVVLDSGSMLNFISERMSNLLNINKLSASIAVKGINPDKVNLKYFIKTNIFSKNLSYTKKLSFYIVPTIVSTFLPSQTFCLDKLNIPDIIKHDLADPNFNVASDIDALLGAEIFFDLFSIDSMPELKKYENINLFKKSKLGWIASGRVDSHVDNELKESRQHCLFTSTDDMSLDSELQLIPRSKQKLKEDELVEKHFLSTHKRLKCGNFVVNLPLKEDPLELGETCRGAIDRFLSLERKFVKNQDLFTEYSRFMHEYIELGHMEEVPEDQISVRPHYYLPHHAVFKDSTTTHLRVVFDASFKGSNNKALNDILMPGPALHNELFDVLIRFRQFKYAMSGDIGKMYRMIYVNPEQTNLQRIVWRDSPCHSIKHYRLRTVTYGTNSAPFLAIRCLNQLAFEAQDSNPKAAKVIKTQFYVDDLLFSEDTENEVKTLHKDISDILARGGFTLRKLCTNSVNLFKYITNLSSDDHHVVELGEDDSVKTLGLIWRPINDSLQFKVHANALDKNITKRHILSDVAKFFDPLGFLTPVIILAKIFIQELWQTGLGWDDTIPDELQKKWYIFRHEMQELNKLIIPRHIRAGTVISVHGFCDASEKAYGCAIYLLSESEGVRSSSLICAKARVATIKSTTLPRLELNGAVLLVELMDKIINTLQLQHIKRFYWTDSQIVLSWISGHSRQWKTYVANRVSIIQNLSNNSQWHYVPSKDNIADIASRGLRAGQFVRTPSWWSGPVWLTLAESEWPQITETEVEVPLPETRPIKYSLLSVSSINLEYVNQISSWRKLLRVTAFVLKFIHNVRRRNDESIKRSIICSSSIIKNLTLSEQELERAKILLCKSAQYEAFEREFHDLNHIQLVNNKSKLKSLSPYLDVDGIIRVGGRLNNANISDNQKHPIVLPAKSHITKLIFVYTHEKHHHVGPQTLLSIIRCQFWPLNGKNIAKQIVHSCVKCFKAKPKSSTQLMGQLPSDRVNPSRPFSKTGVDYCGPIFIRSGIRKIVKIKAYISVFVCFSTKAVHLELVTDLTTAAFLAALRRFFARRGKASDMFSDNATNFVGANRELHRLFYESCTHNSVQNYISEENIRWHFIPANSPHFGGLWEGAVKSLKHHLVRVAGKSLFTFEEMLTLLCEVEACLNSRPLTCLSSDPSEYTTLTPAHFLVGGPLFLPDQSNLTGIPENRLKRWQLVQASLQQFWNRWSSEYLSSLQRRAKWTKNNQPLSEGMIVLIKEEDRPPLHWRLGRVVQLHPGQDNCVRVASVKTSNGTILRRATVRLCPLPSPEEDQL